jgi:hypothetical protein
MKRFAFVFLVITFCLQSQFAFCQVKGDFSDWNVPPPVPTGTIPKAPGGAKPISLAPPSDIAAPNQPLTDLKLAALSAAFQGASDVPAPAQPQFPSMPFAVPDIPLPLIPVAMGLPKQTLHDEIIENNTDMPQPAVPETPELPKMPKAIQKPSGNIDLKLPLIPAIIAQPGTVGLPAEAFPFQEWPVPEIPENAEITASLPANINDDKVKPDNKKKTAKKLK